MKSMGFHSTTRTSHPCRRARSGRPLQAGQAGQGRAGQGRAGQGRAGEGRGSGGQGASGPGAARGPGGRGQAGAAAGGVGSQTKMTVWGPSLLPDGREVIRGAASLQSSYTGRLYPPSPSCRDAPPGASVGASSAHANGQRRSRQFLGFGV